MNRPVTGPAAAGRDGVDATDWAAVVQWCAVSGPIGNILVPRSAWLSLIELSGRIGAPTIQNDLKVFDKQFGFPDPVLQIDKFGKIPPFDGNDSTMVGWAVETTLDVEYAHSIAPGANIVLAETPVAETGGVTGFPEMMQAEDSLIKQGVGDVITQSFGATENTFPGFSQGDFSSLLNLRFAFKDAQAHHVTVLASFVPALALAG